MRLSRGRPGDVLSTRTALGTGAGALLATAAAAKAGWCACTLFCLTSWLLIGTAVLLLGNRSFGVMSEEKEKKTLDCLRLTQLSASSIFWYKLLPEFRSLARLLVAGAPAVLLAGYLSPSGLASALGVLLIAALSGGLSIVSSLFVSSMAASTSRAVVQGWTLKACWLLLTPVLDLVVSAVMVTTTRFPVFDAINPFAAAWPLVMPEAQQGLRAHLPLAFVALSGLAIFVMWLVAARRYENGLVAAPTLTDRQIHQLYRTTPAWVPNLLGARNNPVFLRELASQLRGGAGKWPGYAVFLTLFLAPYLYSQSWNQRRSAEMDYQNQTRLQVSSQQEVLAPTSTGSQQPSSSTSPFIRLRGWDGTELRLKGHTQCACARMAAYEHFHVPLPASAIVKVEYRDPIDYVGQEDPSRPGPAEVQLSQQEASEYGISSLHEPQSERQLSAGTLEQIRIHSMHQGLLGCLVLLSLYLGVRCSGFLANAVTSERDRRSWTDLALTGISPAQVLQGKLMGTLLMPCLQMLVAAPALLVFTSAGALNPLSLLQFIAYAVALAVVSGLIGFWASSASRTSHGAQGLALGAVLTWLLVSPVVSSNLGWMVTFGALSMAALARLSQAPVGMTMGWTLVTAGSLLSPLGLSPWTALKPAVFASDAGSWLTSGLPAWTSGMLVLAGLACVCYSATLSNLQQPGQDDTLRAEVA